MGPFSKSGRTCPKEPHGGRLGRPGVPFESVSTRRPPARPRFKDSFVVRCPPFAGLPEHSRTTTPSRTGRSASRLAGLRGPRRGPGPAFQREVRPNSSVLSKQSPRLGVHRWRPFQGPRGRARERGSSLGEAANSTRLRPHLPGVLPIGRTRNPWEALLRRLTPESASPADEVNSGCGTYHPPGSSARCKVVPQSHILGRGCGYLGVRGHECHPQLPRPLQEGRNERTPRGGSGPSGRRPRDAARPVLRRGGSGALDTRARAHRDVGERRPSLSGPSRRFGHDGAVRCRGCGPGVRDTSRTEGSDPLRHQSSGASEHGDKPSGSTPRPSRHIPGSLRASVALPLRSPSCLPAPRLAGGQRGSAVDGIEPRPSGESMSIAVYQSIIV